MKRFDVVEVFQQPHNQFVQLEGAVCIITEEPQDGYAQVAQLSIEGNTTGEGTLPLDCLKLVTKPVWKAVAQTYRQNVLTSELAEYNYAIERSNKKLRKKEMAKTLAVKYGLTEELIKTIYHEMRDA